LSVTHALSLAGLIVLCGYVLEAATTTQLKRILTLIMCQPLIFILAKFRQKEKFTIKKYGKDMILEVFNRQN
jgi:hypothetical protein